MLPKPDYPAQSLKRFLDENNRCNHLAIQDHLQGHTSFNQREFYTLLELLLQELLCKQTKVTNPRRYVHTLNLEDTLSVIYNLSCNNLSNYKMIETLLASITEHKTNLPLPPFATQAAVLDFLLKTLA